MAAKHGFSEHQGALPREDLGLEASALGYLAVKPGCASRSPAQRGGGGARDPVGVGPGRLDDEIVDVSARDVLRVGPSVTRVFEAGPEGLEYVVFSPRRKGRRGDRAGLRTEDA